MPVLVDPVAVDLDELLKDGGLASIAFLCEFRRVMVMTKDLSLMLIVTVLSSKHRGADRARKVIDVVFAVQRSDV